MSNLQFQFHTLKILHRWPKHLLRWGDLFCTKEIEFFVCRVLLSSLSPSILLLEPSCLRIYREKFLRIDLLIRFGKKISKISASQLVWFFWFFPTNFINPSLTQDSEIHCRRYYQLCNYERILFYFCFCLYFWMTCKQCKYMYFVNMCKKLIVHK